MKQQDMNEMATMIQLDHELQTTINELDLLETYINSVIASRKLNKLHLVKDGDLLRDLAERYYGSQSYWVPLGKYNGLKAGVLTKGTELVIPEKDELDTWLQIQG